METNWRDVTKHLETEWRRLEGIELEPQSPAPFALSTDELLRESSQRERQSRTMVDAAIRLFIRDGNWPELSHSEQFFLQRRLYYGWLLMDVLAREEAEAKAFLANPKTGDTGALLEWLLIDLWPTLGFPLWMETQAQYYSGCANTADVL